jgi:hypothetical protein
MTDSGSVPVTAPSAAASALLANMRPRPAPRFARRVRRYGVLHDVTGTDPTNNPSVAPSPRFADDDEVRRVPSRPCREARAGLRGQPLLALRSSAGGDRPTSQGRASRFGTVDIAVAPRRAEAALGSRSRYAVTTTSLGGLRHFRGPVHGVQTGRESDRPRPVVHRDAALAAQRHDQDSSASSGGSP